jgi:UDP-N-acetylglucosamine enolpyruvyl transferase
MAAIEPHVINVVDFFKKAGADIEVKYNHKIVIN